MSTQTATKRAYNFSAGPAILPECVLEQIREEIMCLPGVGSSILEISHRSPAFGEILDDARNRFRSVFAVPDTHEILFLQGGACLQNAMIPANLLIDENQTGDYLVTGAWSKKSSAEVARFGKLNIVWNGESDKFNRLPKQDEIKLTDNAAYLHYTSNETIHGLQFKTEPESGDIPLVADMSSDVLCRPLDISKYGMIYACAQKNSGVAGLTVIVLRKDLMERCGDRLPTYLNYSKHATANSMANTPPTFAIYVLGLVCKWLQDDIGGLEKIYAMNQHKSSLLYDVIDSSNGFYKGHTSIEDRSIMNVVFNTNSDEITQRFLESAAKANMTTLKGHRSLGGIRASIYNAMPTEGVECLAQFMKDFAQSNA